MLRQEKEHRLQQMSQLNAEYNEEMQHLEANRQAEINAKKNCRPRVYGDN